MKDSEFKVLSHRVGDLRIGSRGAEVAAGYRPDVTVMDRKGKLRLILESEQKTDRKAFLGDVVKAQRYAEECNASPMLVIVMQVSPNTKVDQIARHLQPYVRWLKLRLREHWKLKGVLIVSDTEYLASVKNEELLTSREFLERGNLVR